MAVCNHRVVLAPPCKRYTAFPLFLAWTRGRAIRLLLDLISRIALQKDTIFVLMKKEETSSAHAPVNNIGPREAKSNTYTCRDTL